VPWNWPDKKLASRVRTQRSQHATGFLSPERQARLEALGFFQPDHAESAAEWDQHLAELVEFHRTYGHSHVPWNWSKNVTLGRPPYTGTLRKQTNRNHRKQSHGSGLMNGVQAQRAD